MLQQCDSLGREQQIDNQDLGAMEYFILAVIHAAGLSSLYEFQQQAGLQPGGIRPAMQRLENEGLVTREKSAARRRREITLTEDGIKLMQQGRWHEALKVYTDAESVLRIAAVAILMGKRSEAVSYLERCARNYEILAEDKRLEADRLGKKLGNSLSTYRWMRALSEAQRREAEHTACSSISQFLKE